MMWGLPPGLFLILGALLVPVLRGHWRQAYVTVLPLLGLWALTGVEHGEFLAFTLFEYSLVPVRIDGLSLVFGYVFHVAAALVALYAWHNRNTVEQMAALAYAGSGIGAVFAGDFITLFVYWEAMALTSVFLIWARRTTTAYRSGMRYLIIQVFSGVLLLSGVVLIAEQTGTLTFDRMEVGSLATWLILIAFGIKCAFPLFHNWLSDAYPEATVTGTVYLSAFTTKCAVYALARGFPGTELLIYVGAVMTVFPIFYAVIENDLRRVLAYALNSQLGFMVCGIGVGTALAINGAVAHALVSTLYKALLFMAMGAILLRTGTVRVSELGGLYRSMPFTAVFCIIGALTISAFPLFSGFVAKSLTFSAVGYKGYETVWMILLFASAGVIHYAGLKVPYFGFFGPDTGKRCREAPLTMLLAMGVTAGLCIALGVHSPWLYGLLPFPLEYEPYSTYHIINQVQLLLFSALAFALLLRYRLYPRQLNSVNLDFDIVYRRWLPYAYNGFLALTAEGWRSILQDARNGVSRIIAYMFQHHGPEGILARTWPTGSMALWVSVLLGIILLISYV